MKSIILFLVFDVDVDYILRLKHLEHYFEVMMLDGGVERIAIFLTTFVEIQSRIFQQVIDDSILFVLES